MVAVVMGLLYDEGGNDKAACTGIARYGLGGGRSGCWCRDFEKYGRLVMLRMLVSVRQMN